MKLTEKEEELIKAIRNYHRAYPNGAQELEWYIETILQELLER